MKKYCVINNKHMPNKLYCYVDESGPDTKGEFYVVAIVIVSRDLDAWYQSCERFEKLSGKGSTKWKKSAYRRRLAYMQLIIENPLFLGKIAYAVYTKGLDYDDKKAKTIALAARYIGEGGDMAIIIDGLRKREFPGWGKRIRQQGVRIWKIGGANDENSPLIRLADSVCGLVRDACHDQKRDAKELFYLATEKGIFYNLLG